MVAARTWTGRPAVVGDRAAAELRLAQLREALREALAEKKARLLDFVEACKADRRAVREQVQGMRARSLRDLRDQVQAARGAAKLTRLTRLAEVRQVAGAAVDRARAMAAVERHHQEELARIARDERSRRVEIRLAHERALAAEGLRSSIFGKLAPLFARDRSVRPAPGESRAEAVLRFAERNPERTHAAVEPQVHRKVEDGKRAVAAAERAVRLAGGDPGRVRAQRGAAAVPMRPVERASTTAGPPKPKSARPPPLAPQTKPHARRTPAPPPAVAPVQAAAIAASPASKRKGKPARPKAIRGEAQKASKASEPGPPPKTGAQLRSTAAPKRRKGQIPPGGMLLEDLMRERAEMAASKAARSKRAGAKKGAEAPPAPPSPPPRDPVVVAGASTGAPANDVQQSLFTSTITQSVRPYKVRASCGHIVVRPMREATAGVPYSPDVVLDAPKGRACDACEAKKNFATHAPSPAPEKEVKAPELKDTAEIAKRIRADVQEAVSKKELPKGKYSVRTSKYSMGSSIDIAASGLPFPMLNPAAFRLEKGSSHMAFDRDKFTTRYTPEAERVLAKLNAIVDAYHWDRSDLQSDYHHSRFHRDVRLDDEAEWRRINAEKVAAARAPVPGANQP